MVTIHAQLQGDKALLDREDLNRLVALAGGTEQIDLRISEEDVPTTGIMRLAEQAGSLDFWNDPGEEIYTLQDGEPV